VVVWLLFSWLAQMGNDPKDLVKDLRKLNDASWQKALTLADLLRNKQYEHLKYDESMAQEIAGVLDAQLDAARFDPERIKLRVFLCRVLGEFHVADGVPALVKAATLQRDPAETDVRRAAIEALALLANNLGPKGPVKIRADAPAMRAIEKAAVEKADGNDDGMRMGELRSTAAYALGVIGGDEALDLLDRIQNEDPFANARYNAATGLARHGDTRATAGLLQMLDPDNAEAAADEPTESAKNYKRTLVQMNGIRAAKQLAERRPSGDLAKLEAAISRLQDAKVELCVRKEATEALYVLKGKRN
jgi:HEAT repeat protein